MLEEWTVMPSRRWICPWTKKKTDIKIGKAFRKMCPRKPETVGED
jgi:hypothetical protein